MANCRDGRSRGADHPGMSASRFRVEQNRSSDFGACPCCGRASRTVSGFLHSDVAPVAAYFVQWTLGRPDHGANFDFILGRWGEGARREDRCAVSLLYRIAERGPEFMVIDSDGRPCAGSELVGRALRRDQVIGTDLARQVFAAADAVYGADDRIAEIRSP